MINWRKILKEFFTIGGRLGRKHYSNCIMAIWLPFAIFMATKFLLDDVFELSTRLPTLVASLEWSITFTAYVLFFAVILLTPRRLHDFDYSGWWTWLLVVMIFTKVQLVAIPILLFYIWVGNKKGTDGKNRFGEPPDDD